MKRSFLLNPERKDYLKLYKTHRIIDWKDRFNLLWMEADDVDNAYAFACGQLQFAMQCAAKARKEADNQCKHRVIPRSINKDGSLRMIHPHDWCSGFFPGSLWQVYAYTNDDFWRQQAISNTWLIEEAKWHKGTHDLGFMMNNSFGKAYQLTGERSYKDVVLQSAKTLITRYNKKVKSIRSWDHNRDKWKFPVIIDNLMNLEMLFWATQETGDSIYWKVAVNHANTTMKNHFRPDYSSFHVVDYDPETGEVRARQTAQGYADDSFWSRGQAWFQKVVHMIRTKHKYATVFRHFHIIESTFQSDNVLDSHLLASCRIRITTGGNNRSFVRMAVRRQGVSGLLVFHRQDSISMAFHIGRELVERQSVKLVVRHAGCLRLKFVQTYRYIAFRQVLNGD